MNRLLSAAAGLALAAAAHAQPPAPPPPQPVAAVHRLSTVMGADVVLGTGAIGKVTDVVISDTGCIDYVVVNYGQGFVPVPWSAAILDHARRTITFRNTAITRGQLDGLVFTAQAWPNFMDVAYTDRMRTVYGEAVRRSGYTPSPATVGTAPAPGTTIPNVTNPGTDPNRVPPLPGTDPTRVPPVVTPPASLPNPNVPPRPAAPGNRPGDPVTTPPNAPGTRPTVPPPGSPVIPNPGSRPPGVLPG